MLGGDVATSYWQDVAFAVQTLGSGELPLWNPFERGGYPFVADAQTACYAPLSWLTWLLGIASQSHGPWLQAFRQLGSCVLAGLGMHLFGRTLGLGHGACALGGSVMAVGAFARRTIMMATYWPFAYLGFVLAAVEAVVHKPTPRRTQMLVLALIGLGTSGFPPSIFYCLLIVVPYAILRLIQVRSGRSLVALAIAGLVAGLAELVVVVPLFEQTALSARANRGLSYVLSDPGRLEHIATLVYLPQHGKSIYIGLVGLVAALAGLSAVRGRFRGLVGLLIVVGGFAFVLSSGDQTPTLGWLARHVPGFDLFRIAKRYAGVTHGCLAILAMIGGSELAAFVGGQFPVARRWLPGLAGGLVLLNAADLGRYQPPGTYRARPEGEPRTLLARVGDDRIYNEWGLGPRPGSVYRVRDWRGRSLDPMAFARYLQVERRHRKDPSLLRHFGVRWVLTGHRREVPSPPRVRRPAQIAQQLEPGVWKVTRPAPDAYFTADWVRVAPGKALRSMTQALPGQQAFVEFEPKFEARAEPASTVSVLERNASTLVLSVDAPQRGFVVVNEVWHPGWRVEVDGAGAEVLRLNHLVRGVEVGPGVHTIRMVFAPTSVRWLAPLFLVIVLGALIPWSRGAPKSR